MHFVVIGKDKGAGELRRAARPEHLRYIAEKQGLIVFAGPLIDDGRMMGSLFVFDVESRDALDGYMAEDPYFTPGIFESVEIYESRRMVPEKEAGFLPPKRSVRASRAKRRPLLPFSRHCPVRHGSGLPARERGLRPLQ